MAMRADICPAQSGVDEPVDRIRIVIVQIEIDPLARRRCRASEEAIDHFRGNDFHGYGVRPATQSSTNSPYKSWLSVPGRASNSPGPNFVATSILTASPNGFCASATSST